MPLFSGLFRHTERYEISSPSHTLWPLQLSGLGLKIRGSVPGASSDSCGINQTHTPHTHTTVLMTRTAYVVYTHVLQGSLEYWILVLGSEIFIYRLLNNINIFLLLICYRINFKLASLYILV